MNNLKVSPMIFNFEEEVKICTKAVLLLYGINTKVSQPVSDWGVDWSVVDRALEPPETMLSYEEDDTDTQIDIYQLSHDPKLEGYETDEKTFDSYEDRRGK